MLFVWLCARLFGRRNQKRKRMKASEKKEILCNVFAKIDQRHLNHWLWKNWRRIFSSKTEIADFLLTDYKMQPRYIWLCNYKSFLRKFFGYSIQEMRPMNYQSRHFGDSWMNVQKVLRRNNREPMPRWEYHYERMLKHIEMLEYLKSALEIEDLVAKVDGMHGVAYMNQEGNTININNYNQDGTSKLT